jgi:hypothetical protein
LSPGGVWQIHARTGLDSGTTGIWFTELPITPEKIVRALEKKDK